MTIQQRSWLDWLLKQGASTVILVCGMYFMQDYFKAELSKKETYFINEISKRDTKISILESKVDKINEQNISLLIQELRTK